MQLERRLADFTALCPRGAYWPSASSPGAFLSGLDDCLGGKIDGISQGQEKQENPHFAVMSGVCERHSEYQDAHIHDAVVWFKEIAHEFHLLPPIITFGFFLAAFLSRRAIGHVMRQTPSAPRIPSRHHAGMQERAGLYLPGRITRHSPAVGLALDESLGRSR
jgi:hypothetical protein